MWNEKMMRDTSLITYKQRSRGMAVRERKGNRDLEASSQEGCPAESSLKMKAVLLPIKCTLPLLFFHLLPTSNCQKEFLNEIQGWNYRDGADRVNIQGLKSITRMLEKWGNSIFWQMKHSLLSHPNTLLPELSSLRPFSEAVDNLLKQVHSIKKRLASLNERLDIMSRALFPIRYKALRSQRLSSIQLRRLSWMRRRMYLQRQAQRN